MELDASVAKLQFALKQLMTEFHMMMWVKNSKSEGQFLRASTWKYT